MMGRGQMGVAYTKTCHEDGVLLFMLVTVLHGVVMRWEMQGMRQVSPNMFVQADTNLSIASTCDVFLLALAAPNSLILSIWSSSDRVALLS